MDKNQMIKNLDVDTSFLSLSLSERLYLSDTSLYSKSGFNILRPQAQRVEPGLYQDLKSNLNHSFKYSQSNSLQQIDQTKYQVLNGPESQKCNEDYDLVRSKLEVVQSSVSCLRNEVASLHETLKNSNKDEQIISLVETKLTQLSLKNEKFENFLLKLPLDIETIIKKTVNDAVIFLERSIDQKMEEQVRHVEIKTKEDSCKKLRSIKKSKINKYHLLNKLKNYKNLVQNGSENGVRKRRLIQTDSKNLFDSNGNNGLSSQDSIGSLFEFED